MKPYSKANNLRREYKDEEALSIYQNLLPLTENLLNKYNGIREREIHTDILDKIGMCLSGLCRDEEALTIFLKSYDIKKDLMTEDPSPEKKCYFAFTAYCIGDSLYLLERYNEALEYYRTGMRTLNPILKNCDVANAYDLFEQIKKAYERTLVDADENQSKLDEFSDA
ncbi:MAG TPA: hypothetical protein O0X25_04050 [Methanocorpusculum sp.]|nr:hypothetical protein [Methanocorpusculum sp.]HJJ49771.1 hypothetical protein [Methanocorpusculum sp.]